jgi:uncharacterized protein YbcI
MSLKDLPHPNSLPRLPSNEEELSKELQSWAQEKFGERKASSQLDSELMEKIVSGISSTKEQGDID